MSKQPFKVDVGLKFPDGTVQSTAAASGAVLAVQATAPTLEPGQVALWIQTGLGPLGNDMTFWVEDGL